MMKSLQAGTTWTLAEGFNIGFNIVFSYILLKE